MLFVRVYKIHGVSLFLKDLGIVSCDSCIILFNPLGPGD